MIKKEEIIEERVIYTRETNDAFYACARIGDNVYANMVDKTFKKNKNLNRAIKNCLQSVNNTLCYIEKTGVKEYDNMISQGGYPMKIKIPDKITHKIVNMTCPTCHQEFATDKDNIESIEDNGMCLRCEKINYEEMINNKEDDK